MIRVSTGYVYKLLNGAGGFVQQFEDAIIRVYSGPIPTGADAAPQGVYLGAVTRDGLTVAIGHGLSWTVLTNGYALPALGINLVLTGMADGIAGWCRLSAVTDTPVISSSASRIDFEINSADGNGLKLANPNVSEGLARAIDPFNYTIQR